MNTHIKNLMEQAGYAAPEIAKRAQDLVKLVVDDIIAIIDLEDNNSGDESDIALRQLRQIIDQRYLER